MLIFVDHLGYFGVGVSSITESASAGANTPFDRLLWERLAPGVDPLAVVVPAGPDDFWQRGFVVERAASSQYDALRDVAATASAPGPVWCVVGRSGTCHGQHGRPWAALPGNLHLSLLLLPEAPLPTPGPVLNALPAVATLDAVGLLVPDAPANGLKWVNDVVVGGAKLAGVLTSTRTRDGLCEAVHLGIGLNVATAPILAPDRFTSGATCLDAWSPRPLALREVTVAVLDAVRDRWQEWLAQGPGPLLAAYRAADDARGRPVAVWPDDGDGPLITGTAAGIDDDLGLLLAGHEASITRGRLAYEDP